MGEFFIYILKSAACLILFYLFYKLLMSRETFHRFNRIALLGVLLISTLIPLIKISTDKPIEIHQTVSAIEGFIIQSEYVTTEYNTIEKENPTNWKNIVFFIYFLGIIFFICCNLYSLARMFYKLYPYERKKLETGTKLILHDMPIAPFSWINYIVISEEDYNENGREILIHEHAHIKKHHSIDVFIVNICSIIQWFNPAIWLIRQELQNIHEYEADESVIKEGVDAKQYQLLLIKKAVGKRLYSMANSFNHSKLKKRITMMSKKKSNPWGRLKYLYILPAIAVSITVFARPEVSKELNEISKVKVNDLATVLDEKENKNSETEKRSISKGNSDITSQEESQKELNNVLNENVTGLIVDSNETPLSGAVITIVSTGEEIISDANGKFSFKAPVNSKVTIVYKNTKINATSGPYMCAVIILPKETKNGDFGYHLTISVDDEVIGKEYIKKTIKHVCSEKDKSVDIINLEKGTLYKVQMEIAKNRTLHRKKDISRN